MPVRYPCQDPAGLPADLAQALERWATKPPERVGGWCYRACEDILRAVAAPNALRLVGGYVRMDVPLVVGKDRRCAMLHWWLERGDRVVDPTRQQLGRGRVTYWRARAEHLVGDIDGYKLTWVVSHALDGNFTMRQEDGEARLFATVLEAEPCYADQGWQRAQRTARVLRRAA